MELLAKHPWLTRRGTRWYLRAKVPADIAAVFPGKEVKISLRTADRAEANRRIHAEAAKVEARFAAYRLNGEALPAPPMIVRYATSQPRFKGMGPPPADLRSSELLTRSQVDDLVTTERKRWAEWIAKPVLSLSEAFRQDQIALLEMDAGWRGSSGDELSEACSKAALVLEAAGYYFDRGGANGLVLAEVLQELERDAYFNRVRRLRGLPSLPSARQREPLELPTSDLKTPQSSGGKSLDEVLAAYKSDPDRENITSKTRVEDERTFSIMREVLGGSTTIGSIRRPECRAFKDLIRRLPKNARITCRDLNAKQAADAAEERKLPRLSSKGANKYIHKLSAIMSFALENGFIAGSNPAGKLAFPHKHSIDDRHPFSSEAITRIFRSERFLASAAFAHVPGKGAFFWVPLLALFMGLRMGEACQLEARDFETFESFWYINLVEDEGRSLKTDSAKRQVPCHPVLVALGFRAFVDQVRAKGLATRLFSEEERGRDGYFSPYSKRFGRFLSDTGAKSSKTSFHSLRHNFRDALRDAEINDDIAFIVGGWSNGWSSSGKTYGFGELIRRLSVAISKVEYPTFPFQTITEKVVYCTIQKEQSLS